MKRQLNPKNFFTQEEETLIISAIKEAEKTTCGEIRVHLAKEVMGDPIKEAVRIFNRLGMQKTKQHNGSLILIGLKNKKIAVVGDSGINVLVGADFWNDVVSSLCTAFKNENYASGLSQAILMIGEKLKLYFPYASDDINELSDEISKED